MSIKFEYRAMPTTYFELIWLRGLLAELGFPQHNPTSLYVDNTSVIPIIASLVFHERTKHIKVDYHSICETYDDRVISLPHVTIQLQVVDIFMKDVPCLLHQFLVSKFLFLDQAPPIWGEGDINQ